MPIQSFTRCSYVAVLASLLSACATLEETQQQQVADIPEAERAYIAGSFTIDCVRQRAKCHSPFNSISTGYQHLTDPDLGGPLGATESGWPGDTVYDYIDLERARKGFYFCYPLPAGDYAFRSYSYQNASAGSTSYTLREEHEFNIPFRAEAGTIAYLGDLRMTHTSARSLLGIMQRGPGQVVLAPGDDTQARSALAKCPESAQRMPLRMMPLKGVPGGHELVVEEPAR